jgi:uncharacterized protein
MPMRSHAPDGGTAAAVARQAARSRTRRVAIVVAVAAAVGCDGGSREFLSIGTGGTGGVYFPLGGAIANRLAAADSTRSYTAEVTGGSVENIQRIRNGQIDLAFTIATSAYEASHGGGDFTEPYAELRVAAPLYANLTHVLVPARSDARTIPDLRGRRIAVGAAGSGTEQVARHLLEAAGIDYEAVDERFLSFSESAAALADGAIDAAILSVGYPASAVLEATTTGGARLLPIEASTATAMRERHPFYTADVIPAGVYAGQDSAIASVAVLNWIVADASLDSAVVTDLLRILDQDRAALARVAEIANQIDLGRLAEAPIPLHSAAAAWLRSMAPGS